MGSEKTWCYPAEDCHQKMLVLGHWKSHALFTWFYIQDLISLFQSPIWKCFIHTAWQVIDSGVKLKVCLQWLSFKRSLLWFRLYLLHVSCAYNYTHIFCYKWSQKRNFKRNSSIHKKSTRFVLGWLAPQENPDFKILFILKEIKEITQKLSLRYILRQAVNF